MVWFKFTEDFNFTPKDKPQVTIAYKAGDEFNVTRECAAKAKTLGRGDIVRKLKPGPKPAEEKAEAPQFSDAELDASDGNES